MWNKEKTLEVLASLPDLYATEDIPVKDKVVGAHFFIGAADWWIVEHSKEQPGLMFGYACLGDPDCAEWGYIDFNELAGVKVKPGIEVDFDLHWQPKPVNQIPAIRCY